MTNLTPEYDIESVAWSSDRHIRIEWKQTPSVEWILSAAEAVRSAAPEHIADVVHAYHVITATIADHAIADAGIADKLLEQVRAAVLHIAPEHKLESREFIIPVQYNGPDLHDVAKHCGCTIDEVVRRHTSPVYAVRFIGFSPGFAYLDGLDPKLETPRLATPRRTVPAGSVGIGGLQTGMYPSATAGGWRVVGWTGEVLFDPIKMPDGLLRPGDRVRFVDDSLRLGGGP